MRVWGIRAFRIGALPRLRVEKLCSSLLGLPNNKLKQVTRFETNCRSHKGIDAQGNPHASGYFVKMDTYFPLG